ncbi:MAG TPA: DUF4258 domain-containing protein [Acidobacteriota bacterium]|nr:DUF4258 domain-containing protein [Acidobacteriota bacterium]
MAFVHAVEEVVEDLLDIFDVGQAVLSGRIVRTEKDDPRGTRYVVQGQAGDGQTPVGVVGRFPGGGRFLIITVLRNIVKNGYGIKLRLSV